ncbi:MAG: hypothetical protein NVSMB12_06350 [Acidimicrobiales bacterium]
MLPRPADTDTDTIRGPPSRSVRHPAIPADSLFSDGGETCLDGLGFALREWGERVGIFRASRIGSWLSSAPVAAA